MQEMLFTGRGGEGLVLASQILADTFARARFFVQSFPEFKAERRGAPTRRSCAGTPSPSAAARVPAWRIARDNGILSPEGRPLGNLAVLGAAMKLLLPDGLELLEQAIVARTGAAAAANVSAARAGYAHCTRQHVLVGDAPVVHVSEPALRQTAVLFPVSTTDSLHNLTGAWALEHPVLVEACSACALCALFCPEGVITRAGGVMALDERYCKGYGICVAVCPVAGAIRMEEVPA